MQLENRMDMESFFSIEKSYSIVDMLERERAKLHRTVLQYGVSSPQALQQSRVVDNLILLQMKKRFKYVR